MPEVTAETIAELLEEQIFCYLRVVKQIHTDQGVQFHLRLMAELMAVLGSVKELQHFLPHTGPRSGRKR